VVLADDQDDARARLFARPLASREHDPRERGVGGRRRRVRIGAREGLDGTAPTSNPRSLRRAAAACAHARVRGRASAPGGRARALARNGARGRDGTGMGELGGAGTVGDGVRTADAGELVQTR
jgi:hypothetical protein